MNRCRSLTILALLLVSSPLFGQNFSEPATFPPDEATRQTIADKTDKLGKIIDFLRKQGVRDPAFLNLMRFEIERARSFYTSGWCLTPCLSPAGQAIFSMMARTYQGLLDEMEKRDYDVFRSRVRVPRWKKALFALAALPARFGWM